MYIHYSYPWIEQIWPLFWVQSAASWQGGGWNSIYCGIQPPKQPKKIHTYPPVHGQCKLHSREAVGSPCGSQQPPAMDSRWGCTAINQDQAQIKPKSWYWWWAIAVQSADHIWTWLCKLWLKQWPSGHPQVSWPLLLVITPFFQFWSFHIYSIHHLWV